MRPISTNKKRIFVIIGFLLALLILKGILLWTAKPKITVDYVAEYNRSTLPKIYDPNENAAEFYKIAFDFFVKMPCRFKDIIQMPEDYNSIDPNDYHARIAMFSRTKFIRKTWPTDLNDAEQDCLAQWLISNEKAFEHFRISSKKPYFWIEGYAEDNSLNNMKFPRIGSFSELTEAILWNVKLQAVEGRYQDALENILACYRAGKQKSRTPSTISNQLFGIKIKNDALSAVTEVIDHTQIDPQILKDFQNYLQSQFNQNPYYLDFETEKLNDYDFLQRYFVYNKKGNGRLACRFVSLDRSFCDGSYQFKLAYKLLYACLFGPTQNEMIKRIEDKFAAYESVVKETPWQLHLQGTKSLQNVTQKVSESHCGDCSGLNFDEILFPPFYPYYNSYYRLKAQEKALLTIIALHRFKAEKGKLPEKLDELVSDGYLQALPLDPFSDGSLVYRVEGDNFTLYSVGENFKDDSGKEQKNALDEIIFWPIKRSIEKLQASNL